MKPTEVTLAEQAEVARCVSYNPETGEFRHRVDQGRGGRFKAGSLIAASPNKTHGYPVLWVGDRHHLAHRVAWFLSTGEWPTQNIDHIDHDKTNNRFANLRLVSHEQNMRNTTLYKSNDTGVAGVCRSGPKKNKWRVTVNSGGQQIYLGEYKDFFEAVAVRKSAMINHGYHENHGKPGSEPKHV